MSEREIAVEAIEAAMASLASVRRALLVPSAATVEADCVHPRKASCATFEKPAGWLCPDCGAEG